MEMVLRDRTERHGAPAPHSWTWPGSAVGKGGGKSDSGKGEGHGEWGKGDGKGEGNKGEWSRRDMKGTGKSGKGKIRTPRCEYCWRPLTYPSGHEQHQWLSLNCLSWQHYLRGGVSWEQARAMAMETKARREHMDYWAANDDGPPPHPEARSSGLTRKEDDEGDKR